MVWKALSEEYDAALAKLIRTSLKAHRLDIPGTVYFDEGLDHLSRFYSAEAEVEAEIEAGACACAYYVLLRDSGELAGGIGFAGFPALGNCCELQKLYLSKELHGRGMAYRMISFIEEKARESGYEKMYLETHTNLAAAIHIYEKAGYEQIDRPEAVVHSSMNRFFLKNLFSG